MTNPPLELLNVFLCHCSEDWEPASSLYQHLVNAGFDLWMPEKNLLPGQNKNLKIEMAIRNADAVIVILSQNMVNKEGGTQKELGTVLEVFSEKPEGAIFIIPVLLEACEIPSKLKQLQYVDLKQSDSKEKLIRALDVRAQSIQRKQHVVSNTELILEKPLNSTLRSEIDVSNNQESVQTEQLRILARIRKNIASLEANSALVVEHLYPKIATRKVEAQLRYIRIDMGPDDESYLPSVRANFVKQRINAFNKITEWEFTEDDHEFIEAVIDNPEQLHVWLAFEKIGNDDLQKDWVKYKSAVDFLEREQGKVNKTDDKRYEEIDEWTYQKAKSVYGWIEAHMPDVGPKAYAWSFHFL